MQSNERMLFNNKVKNLISELKKNAGITEEPPSADIQIDYDKYYVKVTNDGYDIRVSITKYTKPEGYGQPGFKEHDRPIFGVACYPDKFGLKTVYRYGWFQKYFRRISLEDYMYEIMRSHNDYWNGKNFIPSFEKHNFM